MHRRNARIGRDLHDRGGDGPPGLRARLTTAINELTSDRVISAPRRSGWSGRTLDSIGCLADSTGEFRATVGHFTEALDLYRALGDINEEANTLHRPGRTHLSLGDRVAARSAWEQALRLHRAQGRPDGASIEQRLAELTSPGAVE
jgi:hypothetical protein